MAEYDPQITDPEYMNIYKEGADVVNTEQDYLKSLAEQTKELGALPSKLKQAFQTGKSNLQSQAAQALAGARVARGGRGLAASRQAGATSGRALAELESQSALQQSQATQDYLKAKTAETAEKKKVGEAESLRSAQIAEAKGLVDSIIDAESGVFVTTEADVNNMKTRFRTEIATKYANNPAALAAALSYFNIKLANKGSTEYIGTTY